MLERVTSPKYLFHDARVWGVPPRILSDQTEPRGNSSIGNMQLHRRIELVVMASSSTCTRTTYTYKNKANLIFKVHFRCECYSWEMQWFVHCTCQVHFNKLILNFKTDVGKFLKIYLIIEYFNIWINRIDGRNRLAEIRKAFLMNLKKVRENGAWYFIFNVVIESSTFPSTILAIILWTIMTWSI